ncbi:sensor histidine kinase [Streptacidiphilus sp. P02-A3a]|uniref:sensor histidine kinase n=1 Tax=Streptacidiphilus sp. P02-A3a TaxID=2704468 RepID=UPI0015F9CA2E|nr:histidine kinase [Streptacidiphilus sp. P02-A3a]QMU67715.1 sensor histidine kinase [Streptacidiphilus sp. P02-A3a]
MRDIGAVRIGQPAENRRQKMVKLCWVSLWMLYLAYPVGDLVDGTHSAAERIAGWVMLAAFIGSYGAVVVRRQVRGTLRAWCASDLVVLLAMASVATAACYLLGSPWLTLLSYTAIAAAGSLPERYSVPGVAVVTGYLVVVGFTCPNPNASATVTAALSAFLGGAAMSGLHRMIHTMWELREARAAVAALSASSERLRMARDLHDLLGHSLSLITLKTELTARFLDQERYEEARAQVADIERVSRQSLVDVREAIGGYRRPKLAVELAAVRTALSAADVVVDADESVGEGHPGLGPEEEGALGWALREAATNIVRHSGAKLCQVRLAEFMTEEGTRTLRLEVLDDGSGTKYPGRGNGLTGLSERLALADGTLETGPGPRGRGFRVRATVPLRAQRSALTDEPVAGTVQQ